MHFTITVAVKITLLQKIVSAHYKINLMWLFKTDVGGDGKQLIY